jgi:lipopolysaccharide assembly outer membrane protein LptD (OstA)
MRYDVYSFDNTVMSDNTEYTGIKNRFLPSGYLQWALPLVNYGENITQIIEPKARITAMRQLNDATFTLNDDSEGALLSDAMLFSDNRFSGLDLWENGTFADYGMRYALFDKNGQNMELFLGQSYDFTTKEDTDPNSGFHNGTSDYVGRIGYATSDWLELSNRFRLAENDLSLQHLETSARIGSSKNYFELGHIWATQFIDTQTMDKNINEVMTGTGLQLSQRISIKFNSIYNMTEQDFQRHTGGVYYNHPCYFLALEYKRDNAIKEDYVGNTTIRFNFGISINGSKR